RQRPRRGPGRPAATRAQAARTRSTRVSFAMSRLRPPRRGTPDASLTALYDPSRDHKAGAVLHLVSSTRTRPYAGAFAARPVTTGSLPYRRPATRGERSPMSAIDIINRRLKEERVPDLRWPDRVTA